MYSVGRSGLGSVRGFQYDLGVAEVSGFCQECGNTACICREIAAFKSRSAEIAERRKDTCPGCGINGEVTISHAVNTAVNGISQEVQTAMLLGGVSEGVFASVVQSIESYRLP